MDSQVLNDVAEVSVAAKVSTASAYMASGGSLFLGMNPDWWNVVIAAIGVSGTLAITYYFRKRDDERKDRRERRKEKELRERLKK